MYGIQSHTKKQTHKHNTLPFLSFPSSMQNSFSKKNAFFPLPMFPLPPGPTTYCPTTKYLQHHNHWHLFSDTITSHTRFFFFLLYLFQFLHCTLLHYMSLCLAFTLIGQISWLSCMESWWAKKAKINARQSRDTHLPFSNLLHH